MEDLAGVLGGGRGETEDEIFPMWGEKRMGGTTAEGGGQVEAEHTIAGRGAGDSIAGLCGGRDAQHLLRAHRQREGHSARDRGV